MKMLESEYLIDSFESFSKPNVHIATSPWDLLKTTILNVYAEHLKISSWVLSGNNSAALLKTAKVITASPDFYWHGADRKKKPSVPCINI